MSGGPFLCYRELIPSTGVHCSTFFQCDNDSNYLMTSTAHTLNIYAVRRDEGEPYLVHRLSQHTNGRPQDICTIPSKRGMGASNDRIMITFDKGKIVIAEYSVPFNTLQTISMINAEEGAIGDSAFVHSSGANSRLVHPGIGSVPFISSDCENSLCCISLYAFKLFFVPQQPQSLDYCDKYASPFLVDVSSLNLSGAILDFCFLSGYSRPVVAILQDNGALPVGHAASVLHTCSVTALAVDIAMENCVVLWQQTDLPHDSVRLLRLDSSVARGGALLVTMNALLVVTQESVHGLATNGFARTTVSDQIPLVPWPLRTGVELHSSRWQEVSSRAPGGATIYAVSLLDGTLLLVRLDPVAGESVCGGSIHYDVDVLGSSIPATCFSVMPPRMISGVNINVENVETDSEVRSVWFLGSGVSDCLLLEASLQEYLHVPSRLFTQYSQQLSTSLLGEVDSSPFCANGTPATKRQRRMSRGNMGSVSVDTPSGTPLATQDADVATLMKQEEEALYASSALSMGSVAASDDSARRRGVRCVLRVSDTIPVLGPVLSANFLTSDESLCSSSAVSWSRNSESVAPPVLHSAAAYIAERERKTALMLCTGVGAQASLSRVSRGLRMAKIASRNFSDICGVSSLVCSSQGCTCFFLSRDGDEQQGVGRGLSTSTKETTRVIIAGQISAVSKKGSEVSFRELPLEKNYFVVDHRTVAVGFVTAARDVCIQAYSKGLRVVRLGGTVGEELTMEALQDALLGEDLEMGGMGGSVDEKIVFADFAAYDGWVLALSSVGTLYILKYDEEEESLEMKHKIRSSIIGEVEDEPRERIPQADKLVSATFFIGELMLAIMESSSVLSSNKISVEDEGEMSVEDSEENINNSTDATSEEYFFYGNSLHSGDASTSSESTVNDHDVGSDSCQQNGDNCKASRDIYIVLVDRMGRVSFIEMTIGGSSNIVLKKVFESPALGALPDVLIPGDLNPSPVVQTENSLPPLPPPKRYVTEARLCRIGKNVRRTHAKLCLVALLSTGDVLVYDAVEGYYNAGSKHTAIRSFCKVEHTCATRRGKTARLAMQKLRRAGRVDATDGSHIPFACQPMIVCSSDTDSDATVVVSGGHPLVVSSCKGLTSVQPVGFPELPYAGTGSHITSYYSAGATRGMAVLWREEKLDGDVSSHGGGRPAVSTLSTLGLYKEVPHLISYPSSSVSVVKSNVGTTTHKTVELVAKRTNDKTQQELLRTKTFVLSCSETKEVPFVNEVLTANEIEEEKGTFERFFPDLDSFCNPVNDIGAPPKLEETQYKLAIMQAGGKIADEYSLPPGERVLDVCALYLTVTGENESTENSVEVNGDTSERGALPPDRKKAFVAACTQIDDKHGEDTRGEGRLLFFSLDYAMYQEDQRSENDVNAHDWAAEAENEVKQDDSARENEQEHQLSAPSATQSTAQAQFYGSIKPKLRLLWVGPGPGTIVRQFKEEYVMCTIGSELFIYKLDQANMELDQIAKIFAQFYISTVSVVKDYILLGDACRSVQFIVWRERDNLLKPLGKDYDDFACASAEFVVDGDILGIAVGDDEGNMKLLRYNPRVVESKKGFRLLNVADFHLGDVASVLSPHRVLDYPAGMPNRARAKSESSQSPRPPPQTTAPLGSRMEKMTGNRTSLLVGTCDGGLGVLVPVEERIHRRLALLQSIMGTTVPMTCSLNPSEFRLLKTSKLRMEKKRGILDGVLLWKYINLEASLQDELAGAMGTTADAIIENIQELDSVSSYF